MTDELNPSVSPAGAPPPPFTLTPPVSLPLEAFARRPRDEEESTMLPVAGALLIAAATPEPGRDGTVRSKDSEDVLRDDELGRGEAGTGLATMVRLPPFAAAPVE